MKAFNQSHFQIGKPLNGILKRSHSSIIWVLSIYLLAHNVSLAQEEDIFKGELAKVYNEVKSPEAAAFEKYGNTEVSLYTGTPQINIPLHTLSGREFSLPLALTYDASGIKVEQMATWVGLAWNLNLGGKITRITNGLPDDYITGTYDTMFNDVATQQISQNYIDNYASFISNPTFPNDTSAQNYIQYLFDVNFNWVDAQIDYYQLSAPGLNETVILEKNPTTSGFTAKALNNPRIKIEYTTSDTPIHIATWTITNEDGTKYVFSDNELTDRRNESADQGELMGDAITEYISAWNLTQIVSKNGKDTFDITYQDEGFESLQSFASAAGSLVTEILPNTYNYPAPASPLNVTNVVSSVKQRFPYEIFLNTKKMVRLNRGTRKDVDITDKNKRLASIDIYDWQGGVIKSIEFDNNHYFNSDGLSNANIFSTGKSYYDIRLKMNGISIKGSDAIDYQNYFFEYINPDGLPPRDSFAQDYFGYYNGAGNNTTLYETVAVDNYVFGGADREPNNSYGKIGTLNKIVYPTGGYTEFGYEGHEVYSSSTNTFQDAVMAANLTTSSPTTPDLYRDDQGVLCDDKYIAPFDPRIVIKSFNVLEADDYVISLVSSNNDVEFYLVDPLNIPSPYNNYCDFVNGPSGNVIGLMPMLSSGNQTVYLTPGKYKALLLLGNLNQSPSISASVSISRQVTNQVWANRDIGGQRISSVNDFTSSGNIATKKIVSYNNDNDESTGTVNYKPILHSFRANESENGFKSQLVRYGTYAKGSEPYVTYSSVTESMVNSANEKLGETRHNFYKGSKGSTPMPSPPYENWYIPSLSVGNLSSKSIGMEGGTKELIYEEYDYYETLQRPINIKSLVTYVENDNFQKTIFFKQNNGTDNIQGTSDDFVTLEYLNTFECDPNGQNGGSLGNMCPLSDHITNYQSYGYLGYMDPKYSPYKARVSSTAGAYGGINYYKRESKFYDNSGNLIDTLVSEETTTYDNLETSPKYLPRKKVTSDSKGDQIETTYFYPHDNLVSASSNLISDNRISEVVRTEIKKNPGELDESEISTVEKNFSVFGNAIMPTEIITTKGGQSDDSRGEFEYYSGGNIKTTKKINGPITYYIWGYSSQFPIATIENFDENEATALQSQISSCVSASNSDNGTIAAENALRASLQNLRNALPEDALMTSYTYDPTIGVTSMTDTRGNTSYYEYDEFNRLKEVKDNQQKLLTDYNYHYKGQN
ncbi:RHS repeat domain-containing protein [Maribacter flavus]|uniref:RHS repeat protein n=1 Tax=Maribacter flavus TaxID=1658664 RepID=A0A5B2TPW6_9FLAO|nr:hypothetical protein [Maribacter flavus]KAA2216557.1 hypothetical protein F0361_11170 [Maribacter flavus]